MRADSPQLPDSSKGQPDISLVFQAYKQARQAYFNPGVRGSLLWLIMPSKEDQARSVMDTHAGKLRDMLQPGMLIRFIPQEGQTPLEVVIGRRRGEFTVCDSYGVSLCKNKGDEGLFVPMSSFHNVATYQGIEVVNSRHAPRGAFYERV